jgi:hypothetical protein
MENPAPRCRKRVGFCPLGVALLTRLKRQLQIGLSGGATGLTNPHRRRRARTIGTRGIVLGNQKHVTTDRDAEAAWRRKLLERLSGMDGSHPAQGTGTLGRQDAQLKQFALQGLQRGSTTAGQRNTGPGSDTTRAQALDPSSTRTPAYRAPSDAQAGERRVTIRTVSLGVGSVLLTGIVWGGVYFGLAAKVLEDVHSASVEQAGLFVPAITPAEKFPTAVSTPAIVTANLVNSADSDFLPAPSGSDPQDVEAIPATARVDGDPAPTAAPIVDEIADTTAVDGPLALSGILPAGAPERELGGLDMVPTAAPTAQRPEVPVQAAAAPAAVKLAQKPHHARTRIVRAVPGEGGAAVFAQGKMAFGAPKAAQSAKTTSNPITDGWNYFWDGVTRNLHNVLSPDHSN